MNVTLPDGTVLEDVPDGTTKAELTAKLQANGYDVSKLSASPPAAPPVAPAAPPVAPAAKPSAEPTGFWERAWQGLADPVMGAGQIMDKVLVNPIRQAVSPGATSMEDVVRSRDAGYRAPDGMDWARMAGNVANPMSWLGGGSGTMARLAGVGAVQGGIAPVSADSENFLSDKARQAGLGAVAGAVLPKVLGGLKPTAAAQELMDQGVQPTVGQALGGALDRAEQKASSIPLVGDAVTWARNRTAREFEEKVIGRVTDGEAKTLEQANRLASQKFDRFVPDLVPTRDAVMGVQQKLSDAMQNPELTAEGKAILTGMVQKHFASFGQLSGSGIKKLDSELGYLARKYAAGDPHSRTISSELYNIMGAFRDGLEAGLPAEKQGMMREANTLWRNLMPINKAASTVADQAVRPRAYQKALARQAKTDVTRMPHDPLVSNAVDVMANTVPDSGTAGRLMLDAAGLGAAGTVGLAPHAIGTGALAWLGATRPVQRFALGQYPGQKTAGQALGIALPAASRAAFPEDPALQELRSRRAGMGR